MSPLNFSRGLIIQQQTCSFLNFVKSTSGLLSGFIASMAQSMKDKFDKYWEKSNTALAVACFLDPRYKMKVVEFYYTEMSDDYGFDAMYEFKKVLQKLYDSYASMYRSSTSRPMQQTKL